MGNWATVAYWAIRCNRRNSQATERRTRAGGKQAGSIGFWLRQFKMSPGCNIGYRKDIARRLPVLLIFLSAVAAPAQTCLTTSDMDEPTRNALVATGKRFYDLAAHGDAASLRQDAIASLATNFSGIEAAIRENQANL